MDSGLEEERRSQGNRQYPGQSRHSAQARAQCACAQSHLPRETSPREPAVPLQVFETLFLSTRALLLLAVKMETFYGIYKPEVTQLNETICHIKFTSAGIKRQIT